MSKKRFGLAVAVPFLLAGCMAAATIPMDDDSFMMPYYTGTILPTPQKVAYSTQFAPLDLVGILLGKDVAADDPRLEVLTDRIARYGGRAEIAKALSDPYGVFILLGNLEAANGLLKGITVPEQPEGYLIHCAKENDRTVILLQSRDKMGLLWAIASLNQLITKKDGKPVAQLAEVRDYPETAGRGFLSSGYWGINSVSNLPMTRSAFVGGWFGLRFKMNRMSFSPHIWFPSGYQDWHAERPEFVKEEVKATGRYLSPLGIEWFMGLNANRSIRSKNDDDFAKILAYASMAEDAGGHFCYLQDDLRFPISADDMRDFGSAKEADIFFLNRLWKALKGKYPNAKLLFCPPFYWGPDSPAGYPEPREEYLKALGERLPKEIGVFWTGPRVKSGEIIKSQVAWMTNLIGRKPAMWQNTVGSSHVWGWHYVTDPVTAWTERYYPGFFQDIDGFFYNTSSGASAVIVTLADYLWNPKAYDPKRSIEDAAKKLCGPESWQALVELNKKLSGFDLYGGRVSPQAAKNLAELERQLAETEKAYQNLLAYHPKAVRRWTDMFDYVRFHRNFVAKIKKNPTLSAFIPRADESRKIAEKEVPLVAATDRFLSAYDFLGGLPPTHYALNCEKRLVTWIYGARSGNPAMKAQFDCDPFPPAGDYTLIVSGQDDDSQKSCRIRVLVNDTAVFEGENGFVKRGWSRRAFTVPVLALKRSNTLEIRNIEDSSNSGGPPFFMLNYAVIRKLQADK